jgi:hypothetical protein
MLGPIWENDYMCKNVLSGKRVRIRKQLYFLRVREGRGFERTVRQSGAGNIPKYIS